MLEICQIDWAHRADLLLKNDPFPLNGRMIPCYTQQTWSYTVEAFPPELCSEMSFPDEDYDYEKLSPNSFLLGAYRDGVCIGLAILEREFLRYLYLSDLKVSAPYRKSGVGRLLVERCMEIARAQKMQGVYLRAQDNNLSACLFYVHTGFRIGGLDTECYRGTRQEGKADILFYRDV